MKKTHIHGNRITGIESKLAARDCTWAFAFPPSSQHHWMREEEIVAEPATNRLWAALRHHFAAFWHPLAGRGRRPWLRLAVQAQDFSDLSRILSLPASRTDGAAASAAG